MCLLNNRSTWRTLSKGVPQGSILGPLLFNAFMNDMFLFMKSCNFYNYADDNFVSRSSPDVNVILSNKNIERHTADTIVSWPNPKQWVIVHTSDLMMMIRQSICILSIITREMGKLKTYSPTYCIMDDGENMLNLTHTLDKIYLTGIL